MNKQKIMRDSVRCLKRTKFYQKNRDLDDNYVVAYVIARGNGTVPDDVIAYAGYEGYVIAFRPYLDDEPWQALAFEFDGDLFQWLEAGYGIVGMSLDAHYNAWSSIEEWHSIGEIDCLQGMQVYLGHCKRNGITKERLSKEYGYKGMDVMLLYDGKTQALTGTSKRPRDYEK